MRELLPMIVSIVLFFVTLIVIITLRKADRRDRSLDLVKRYVTQHSEKLHRAGEEMTTKIAEVESRFYKAQSDADVVITHIAEQKKELFSHLEDLQELQGTVVQYHKVLTNLSQMTGEVEKRTQKIKEEMERVKEVEQMIADFNASVAETRQEIDETHQQLHESMSVYKTKIEQLIEDALASLRESFESEKQSDMAAMEAVFQQLKETSTFLLKEIRKDLLDAERSNELLLQTRSSTLYQIQQKCSQQLEEIKVRTAELGELKEQIDSLGEKISSLEIEKKEKENHLTELQNELTSSREEKEDLDDQKKILEEQIEEALRIQRQLREEEELSSLIERERVDYPDMEEGDDEADESSGEPEEDSLEENISSEVMFDFEEESDEQLKEKKSTVMDHQNGIDEIEEGEEEISLEDDENDL
ncbi:MAG: SpiroCoCo family coiled-coil protein [Sphaerochaetaceae bacterium]